MEVLEETKRRLCELEKAVDSSTGMMLPSELTHVICCEYLTSERLMLERVILETGWRKQKSDRKLMDNYYNELITIQAKSAILREYLEDIMYCAPLHYPEDEDEKAKQNFIQAVTACNDRENMCHRVRCFYRMDWISCVCADPICPADFPHTFLAS